MTYRYLYGPAVDRIMARLGAQGDLAWYLGDHLGTVRDLADTSGQVIDHIAYDSFGGILAETNPAVGNRFKFTAREFDVAIEQYYYRARYYEGRTGRFTREDPLGLAADVNGYRYVLNRPTAATDPTGLRSQDVNSAFPDGENSAGAQRDLSFAVASHSTGNNGGTWGVVDTSPVRIREAGPAYSAWNGTPSYAHSAGGGSSGGPLSPSAALANAVVSRVTVTVKTEARWDQEYDAFRLPAWTQTMGLPLRARLSLYGAASKLCSALGWSGSYQLVVPRGSAPSMSSSVSFTMPVLLLPSFDQRLPRDYAFIVYLKVTITMTIKGEA